MIPIRIATLCTCLLCAFSLFVTDAHAEQSTYSQSYGTEDPHLDETVTIPAFDPESGTLQAVEVTLYSRLEGLVFAQSLEQTDSTVQFIFTGDIRLTDSDGTVLATVEPQTGLEEQLEANTIENSEFPSSQLLLGGQLERIISGEATKVVRLIDPATLEIFQESSEVTLPLQGETRGVFNGPGNFYAAMNVAVTAEVGIHYVYESADIPAQNTTDDSQAGISPGGNVSDSPETQSQLNDPALRMNNQIFMPVIGN